MRLSLRWTSLLLLGVALAFWSNFAQAVITRLTPLREVLRSEQIIFTAKVEKLDRDKPAVVFRVDEELKNKPPFRKLVVNLNADAHGQREHDTERLLKRLAVDLPLIIFVSKRGDRSTAFGYTNGTWFQFIAKEGEDSDGLKWNFTHCEPYLRRTYKGSTAELRQIVKEGLSGDKTPPEPDAKEPPGIGPEIQTGANSAGHEKEQLHAAPAFGIIPTFVVLGPLAVLASLGLGAAGLFLRRWRPLILVLSLDSTVYILHSIFRGYLHESWWGTRASVWLVVLAVSALGTVWSYHRYRAAPPEQGTETLPWRANFISLSVLTLASGTLLFLRTGETNSRSDAREPSVSWVFESPAPGIICSSPLVVGGRVYVGAAHSLGLTSYGAVYCLDAHTGQVLWTFKANDELKQVFSSPCLADGRLYIGEGFHEDTDCKLYCLQAATGNEVWRFPTKSHTESSPCVVDGKVYFGAGDDGVYCVAAADGKKSWHFAGLHVDTSPVVTGGRLFAGSSDGGSFEAFCLNADTGVPVWQTPCNLPVLGSPAIAGQHVYFGLGTGNAVQSSENPAGALICLDNATGRLAWRCNAEDAVVARPAVGAEGVYFCSRDRHCYGVSRVAGTLRWKQDMGSPIAAAPALFGSALYVIASKGQVRCLDAATGEGRWLFDAAEHSHANPMLWSSPVIVVDPSLSEQGRQIYFGAGLDNLVSSTAALYRLHDHQE